MRWRTASSDRDEMPPAYSPWTDDKVEQLRRLWSAGYSATQIARELRIGVTRMSVLGKVHRLRLPPRKEPPDASSSPRGSTRRDSALLGSSRRNATMLRRPVF